METKIAVICKKTEYENDAKELAQKINAPLIFDVERKTDNQGNGVPETDNPEVYGKYTHFVRFDENGVSLLGDGLEYRGDYTAMAGRLKHNNLTHELLVKAARIKDKEPTVFPAAIDATAGMGEDSLLLAAAGFRVLLIEKDPIIAALLRDTIRRASNNPELAGIVSRMEVCEGDSKEILKKTVSGTAGDFSAPDVIYLDPMFPEKTKNSLTKKKFQLIHCLESPCPDEEELLEAAIACGAKKIVIKRPLKGPFLGNLKPSYSLTGKTVRYDCLMGKTNSIQN